MLDARRWCCILSYMSTSETIKTTTTTTLVRLASCPFTTLALRLVRMVLTGADA